MIDLKALREKWVSGPAGQEATREVLALIDRCEALEQDLNLALAALASIHPRSSIGPLVANPTWK